VDAALDTGAATAAGIAWVEKRILGRIILAAVVISDPNETFVYGDEVTGDQLAYANTDNAHSGTGPAGSTTWECLGFADTATTAGSITLWQQVG